MGRSLMDLWGLLFKMVLFKTRMSTQKLPYSLRLYC